MDDGTNAVLDAYLFFEGGHWISCGICLAEAEGQWSIDAVNLRLEDWLTENCSNNWTWNRATPACQHD